VSMTPDMHVHVCLHGEGFIIRCRKFFLERVNKRIVHHNSPLSSRLAMEMLELPKVLP
jgi:hypothetical protein